MREQPQYPFVEYGKIFLPEIGRATDFNPLDYSHEYLLGKLNYLRSLVFSPSSETTFKKHVGNVSLALLKFLDPAEGNLERFVFVQMQSRRESELSETPQQHRPFYQIRFSYLKPEDIFTQLRMGCGLYHELVYDQRKYEAFDPHPDALRPMPLRLKNYIREGQKRVIPNEPVVETLISIATLTDPVVRWLTNTLVNVSQNRSISASHCFIVPLDILVPQHGRVQLDDNLENRCIQRRIEILQAVQYLVMPYLGILSFALDYITDQKVNLYLMTSPDPFLMKKLSPEQVHIYSKQSSAAYLDYHETALELVRESEHGLVSDWLYSSRLKALLQKYLALDEAIICLNAKAPKTEKRRIEFLQAHHLLLVEDPDLIAEELQLLSDDGHCSLAQSPQTDSALLHRWLRDWLVLQNKHLGALAEFFLAVPNQKRDAEFYSTLRSVIQRNSPDALTRIPSAHQKTLFAELLKVRDEHFMGMEESHE